MGVDRGHPDLLTLMAEATAELQREGAEEAVRRQRALRYEEGERALAAGDWAAALEAFEEVSAGNPDFRQVQTLLAQARDELRRAQWYDEAIAHGEAQRWAEACRLWVRVLRGRMDYQGGEAAARLLEAVEGVLKQLETANARMKCLTGETGAPPSARARTERPAVLAGDRWRNPKDGKEMVRVPAGKFLYGDDKREVELPEFWIDRAPVTNAEYARFVAETGHEPPVHWEGETPPKEIADHPVVNVSWDDATAYAEWAGGRLPSEQEWEKAARGTDGRKYPWGKWAEGRCNSQEAGVGGTTPVGQYSLPGDSPYGCVDMAGNVWEWTASEHEQGGRVLRGGAFLDEDRYVRCAARSWDLPYNCRRNCGFRVVAARAPG
jgi:formylglycine-generating enzyme required for sulfatase activity